MGRSPGPWTFPCRTTICSGSFSRRALSPCPASETSVPDAVVMAMNRNITTHAVLPPTVAVILRTAFLAFAGPVLIDPVLINRGLIEEFSNSFQLVGAQPTVVDERGDQGDRRPTTDRLDELANLLRDGDVSRPGGLVQKRSALRAMRQPTLVFHPFKQGADGVARHVARLREDAPHL